MPSIKYACLSALISFAPRTRLTISPAPRPRAVGLARTGAGAALRECPRRLPVLLALPCVGRARLLACAGRPVFADKHFALAVGDSSLTRARVVPRLSWHS